MPETFARFRRLALMAAVLPFFVAASACGGGDGGGGGGGVTATFSADAPTPGALSVSLQPGTTGTQFSVIVSVKEVTDFFGAAFSISYPKTVSGAANLDFLGASTTGSFLNGTGVETVFIATDTLNNGLIDAVATRKQNQSGTVPGVDVGTTPLELMRLNFQVRRAMTNAAIAFTGNLKVCTDQPAGSPPVCAEVGGITWSGGKVTAQ